ncbi:hypothetical protein AGDE_06178 [Angomonas deanei]|uniref:PH-like domain-containing protein n=1 Tax=Angomonas deanei TaxID=59799 RepID=A0A7G2CEM9_9TRYP|nr:hypothetical protein AGDE_06178 [Angomonas deanei]CAD2217421.1 hypothetical protein, conserved [Angomonas deanei]|eukprot:EPY37756.1 hypothetical protein AGDE_06178 [Angomonas deanei]
MPPRKPTKNRVNMHDIISQSLDALPNAVDAIIRSPESLDDIEVNSIFEESSFLLLRAEEAISSQHSEAFAALMKIYTEGLSHSESSFEEGIKTISLHRPILQTIHSIFIVVVQNGAFPVHSNATVELIQVISSLCDGTAIKEQCGALFMDDLICLLQRIYRDPEEAKQNFHIQRATMTALINLVKGSKVNKSRRTSWKFAEDVSLVTVDVFFLLQCIELLYRVSRQNKNVLTEIQNSLIAEKLRTFPNDGTLLNRMTNLIRELSQDNRDIQRYPLTHVVAADTTLTGATDAYFTPFYLIIFVTSTNADNITIPYRMIRSVTLGKEGRVVLKLEEFPVKLEALLNRTAGMDIVSLHMHKERLGDFKKSNIRSWIIEALQSRKEGSRLSGTKRPHEDISDSAEKMSVASHPIKEEESSGKPLGAHTTSTKKVRDEPAVDREVVRQMMNLVDELSHSGAQASLVKLKRLIDVKTEYRRGEIVTSLNEIMKEIQEKVDSARHATLSTRENWVNECSGRIEMLERHVLETQEMTARGVGTLNEGLRSIRSSDLALQERIACLDIEFQQALEEARELEQVHLDRLANKFGSEIQRREYEIDEQMLEMKSGNQSSLQQYF